jgi:hypothetical protein
VTATQIFLVFVTVLALGAAAPLLARWRPSPWFLGALVAILAARMLLVTPSFLHASWHATGLLEGIFGFPAEASHRATYGQYGFLALGALARVFGRRFEVVVACNQVFGVIALALLAHYARRVTGRETAAFAVLALGALHPALFRVAASEDAHGLALCLGAASLVAFDLYATDRKPAALVLGMATCILMLHTRQTFYAWAPMVFALAAARDRSLLRTLPFWLAAFAVAIATVQRVQSTMAVGTEQTTLIVLPLLVGSKSLMASTLRYHPLLDVIGFGPVLLGAVVYGAWRAPRMLFLAFLGFFLLTLPFGVPTPGSDLAFRLPAMALAVVIGGIGLGAALERFQHHAVLVASLLAVALLPRVFPSWSLARFRSTDCHEYLALRAALPSLPRELRLLRVRHRDPSWQPPMHLFAAAGISAQLVDDDAPGPGPRVLVAGIQCWGYPLGEGLELGPQDVKTVLRPLFERLFAHRIDLRAEGIPDSIRPECARVLQGAVALTPEIPLPATDDAFFAVYPRNPLPFRIYRLP